MTNSTIIEQPVTQPVEVSSVATNVDGSIVNIKEEVVPVVKQDISNATLTSDFVSSSESVAPGTGFNIPSYRYAKFTSTIKNFNNTNINESSTLSNWKAVVQDSVDFYTTGDMYNGRTTDPTSSFDQGVKDANGTLNTISDFKLKQVEGEIKGELALLKLAKHLGLGDIIRVPLPHSGMWITIKPPTEKDLLDFYNSLYKDKVTLGRSTSGLTLSNFSVYVNNALIDFIIEHVHSISYSDIAITELKKYISIHDLPILAWGFASAIYPTGFEYSRACIADVEKCSNVVTGKINLSKLLWVDNASLTPAQKTIIAEFRPNKLTIDSYNKYKLEHTRTKTNYFKTPNGVTLHLRVPNMDEYITDGLKWVNNINSKVEEAALNNKDEEYKSKILEQYVKSTVLQQYNHFVESIELEENTIVDRDTINNVLELLSGDTDSRLNIIENINKYISDTTIGIVGIPEFKCPVCGANQNTDPVNTNLVDIIPLDTMNLFFSLIIHRISKILEREL